MRGWVQAPLYLRLLPCRYRLLFGINMIDINLFFRCQKILFIYFLCTYFCISIINTSLIIYFIMNFIHLLICHGILFIFCKKLISHDVPFIFIMEFIGIFLIILPFMFFIKELIDAYYINSIINLFLISFPHIILLIYLKGKKV